jgi:hypothetical protein
MLSKALRVVLYKMLQTAAPIAPPLMLAVVLGRLRVSLPVLLLVAGIGVTPLFAAVTNDLGVEGIRADFLAAIVAETLLLAGELATDALVRMIGRRLKNLLAITATAVVHQAAPDQNRIRSFCQGCQNGTAPTKNFAALEIEFLPHIETPIDFFAASPPIGPLLFLAAIDNSMTSWVDRCVWAPEKDHDYAV